MVIVSTKWHTQLWWLKATEFFSKLKRWSVKETFVGILHDVVSAWILWRHCFCSLSQELNRSFSSSGSCSNDGWHSNNSTIWSVQTFYRINKFSLVLQPNRKSPRILKYLISFIQSSMKLPAVVIGWRTLIIESGNASLLFPQKLFPPTENNVRLQFETKINSNEWSLVASSTHNRRENIIIIAIAISSIVGDNDYCCDYVSSSWSKCSNEWARLWIIAPGKNR